MGKSKPTKAAAKPEPQPKMRTKKKVSEMNEEKGKNLLASLEYDKPGEWEADQVEVPPGEESEGDSEWEGDGEDDSDGDDLGAQLTLELAEPDAPHHMRMSNVKRKNRGPRKSCAGRRLVRWSPDKDQLLLLAADVVCVKAGHPIPWGIIAPLIEPYCTAEAIKQHLSKLRLLRAKHGRTVPEHLATGERRKAVEAQRAAEKKAVKKGKKFQRTEETDVTMDEVLETNENEVKVETTTPTKRPPAAVTKAHPSTPSPTKEAHKEPEAIVPKTKSTGKRTRKTKKEVVVDSDSDSDDDRIYDSASKKQRKAAPMLRRQQVVDYNEHLSDDEVSGAVQGEHSDDVFQDGPLSTPQTTVKKIMCKPLASQRRAATKQGPTPSKTPLPPPKYTLPAPPPINYGYSSYSMGFPMARQGPESVITNPLHPMHPMHQASYYQNPYMQTSGSGMPYQHHDLPRMSSMPNMPMGFMPNPRFTAPMPPHYQGYGGYPRGNGMGMQQTGNSPYSVAQLHTPVIPSTPLKQQKASSSNLATATTPAKKTPIKNEGVYGTSSPAGSSSLNGLSGGEGQRPTLSSTTPSSTAANGHVNGNQDGTRGARINNGVNNHGIADITNNGGITHSNTSPAEMGFADFTPTFKSTTDPSDIVQSIPDTPDAPTIASKHASASNTALTKDAEHDSPKQIDPFDAYMATVRTPETAIRSFSPIAKSRSTSGSFDSVQGSQTMETTVGGTGSDKNSGNDEPSSMMDLGHDLSELDEFGWNGSMFPSLPDANAADGGEDDSIWADFLNQQ